MNNILGCLLVAAVASHLVPGQQTRSLPESLSAAGRLALIEERDRLSDLANTLRKQGDVSAAIVKAEEMLAIEQRVFGETSEDVAGTFELLAQCLEERGDFTAALRRYQDLLSVRTALNGADSWQATDARLKVDQVRRVAGMSEADRQALAAAVQQQERAWEMMDKGQYREAIAVFEEVTATRRRILGLEDVDTAAAFQSLGNAQFAMGDYSRAELPTQQALNIRRKLLGAEHPSTAEGLNELGQLYAQMGDYGRAEALLTEALAIHRRVFGDDVPTSRSLNRLSFVYQSLGDNSRAASLMEEALAIRRKRQGEDHPDTALMTANLGWTYALMGDYARAEPLFQRALAIDTKVLGPDHPQTAQDFHGLGYLHTMKGNYVEAAAYQQQALFVRRKVFGFENNTTGDSVNALAVVYVLLGDHARAEPLLQESLEISRKVLGPEHPETATALANLGRLYCDLGDYARAESLTRQAVEIIRKNPGEGHPRMASVLSVLGQVYSSSGEYVRALPAYQQALAIRTAALSEGHPDTARSVAQLGTVYRLMGDYGRAKPLLEQALTEYRKMLGPEHPATANALYNLASLSKSVGNLGQAEGLYRQTLAISRKNLGLVAVVQSERQQLAAERALRYQLDGYLSLITDAPRFASAGWEQVLAWKGAALGRQRAVRVGTRDPDVQLMFADLQSTASRLATLALAIPSREQADTWHRQIGELSERKEQLEGDLRRKSARFRLAFESPTAASVRGAVPEKGVLVDFLQYEHTSAKPLARGKGAAGEQRLIAFLIRPDRDVRLIALGPVAPVAGAIAAWRKGLGTGDEGRAAGQQLRKMIWAPIEAALEDVRPAEILVSPDGVLGQLPLGALPGRMPGTYLLEDWPIATLPAPQTLLELQSNDMRPRPDGNVLLLGNVNYDGRDAPSQALRPFPSLRAAREADAHFAALDGTRGELATVEKLYRDTFGAAGLTTLGGTHATKEVVRREVQRHLYVHFATHGFFAAERFKSALGRTTQRIRGDMDLRGDQSVAGYHPGLLSGLALSGANVPTPDDDGILTAEEVGTLDLSAVQLAVLSACETGLGQVAGGEGLLGLQRAFHAAGARTVIATLWKVDDVATRDLMERFYDNIWNRNMGKLAALREAQIWMLRRRGARGLTVAGRKPLDNRMPPYFWGAFVLSGDWR